MGSTRKHLSMLMEISFLQFIVQISYFYQKHSAFPMLFIPRLHHANQK